MDITIVTPSFNQAKYIQRTLDSVLSQTGDFSLDFIVMDGGSTDETIQIVRRYQAELAGGQRTAACRDVKFRWFSERDRGQSHAINKGFSLAQGRVLGWLNSDDVYYDPTALGTIFAHFRDQPQSSFAYGRGIWIDEFDAFRKDATYVVDFGIEELPEINFLLQPAAFWTRELYQQVGPIDESLHYTMDWDYWVRCSRKTELHFIDRRLACHRDCEDNKTNSGAIKRKAEIAAILLKYGGFSQRAIDWFLVDHPQQQHAPDTQTAHSQPTPILKKLERAILAPTRLLERAIRRTFKKRRPEPAISSAVVEHDRSHRQRAA